MKQKLIIAAVSARAYAQSAHQYGFQVITLDAFADSDIQAFAEHCYKLKYDINGVNEADFKAQFSKIKIDENCYFVYGSLFDAKPNLLAWVAQRVQVLGNGAQTMHLTKSFDFFRLLDDLNIIHPEVQLTMPDDCDGWLAKSFFSTGGMHVKPALKSKKGDYFQRKIKGMAVSLLFLADGKVAKKIGFNQQFTAPTATMPYRFAGAVSNIELPIPAQRQFMEAANKLTIAMCLKGLNSLDAVLESENLWVLELNPRLSATFNLYPNLLSVHMQACAGDFKELLVGLGSVNNFNWCDESEPDKNAFSKAQLIVYADQALNISSNFNWPQWVADIPAFENHNINIAENEPICSVFAQAQGALAAQQLVLQQTEILKMELLNDSK